MAFVRDYRFSGFPTKLTHPNLAYLTKPNLFLEIFTMARGKMLLLLFWYFASVATRLLVFATLNLNLIEMLLGQLTFWQKIKKKILILLPMLTDHDFDSVAWQIAWKTELFPGTFDLVALAKKGRSLKEKLHTQ